MGGLNNFPQGRVQNSFQFTNTTPVRGPSHLQVRGRRPLQQADNQAAFDSKGTFAFGSLENYMNNLATTYNQALQTSSWLAKQWQSYFYAQDDFRVNPDFTLNIGLRYELSDVPLGFFGATDAASLGALVPPPVERDYNNLAPRVGFAWSPRSSGFFGDGKSSIRGGYGIAYDVLFYNLLTVNASNYPRVVVVTQNNVLDVYPNNHGERRPVFNPLAGYVNSDPNTQHPMTHFYSLSMQREVGRDYVSRSATREARASRRQPAANPAILTDAQAALVAPPEPARHPQRPGAAPVPAVRLAP